MKAKRLLFLSFVAALAIGFSSCEDENDTEKPVISALEIGHGDTIHIGEKIHLEFEVSDNDLLDYYRITIHPEGEHKSATLHHYWEFDSTFTEISGLKNYSVHHHKIGVPADIEPGEYHFHLTVVDKAGNSSETERELYATDEDDHHDDHGYED